MKTAGHWRVALVLLPALVGTAACGTGDAAEPGQAVYGQPLAEQFHAATAATRQAGTARFVSTLTYTTAAGEKAVHRTTGSQDYAGKTSRATFVAHVPADFPEKDAEFLGEPGSNVKRTLATAADDVYVRRDDSTWLRFTPAAFNELGSPTGDLSGHAAGDVAPFSGTLADLVPRTIPRVEPEREADGSRVYRVTALPEVAAELLPRALKTGRGSWGSEPVELSVRLDTEGRLTEVSADLGPLLDSLHANKVIVGVTRLQASYRLSAFGEPLQTRKPAKGIEDASKVLVPVGTLAGGRCAALDTGMTGPAVVRPVDCAEPHDIRVFAQVTVDRSFPGKKPVENGRTFASELCREAYADAPKDWVSDSRSPGGYVIYGSSSVSVSHGAGKTETSVTGDYTCYVHSS
ncbi:septum formation family protein [Streptomyces peucetius]|uniref:Septum formation family protein n=1 Tax=Streptomyces peucetius TaxID=1950 RepID=A0ABY6IF01_STRPE|nr:septum formation family protein [Streptomyces peucetius]UYQ65593.1 septum formation family protein [Streptomyces peucetius]